MTLAERGNRERDKSPAQHRRKPAFNPVLPASEVDLYRSDSLGRLDDRHCGKEVSTRPSRSYQESQRHPFSVGLSPLHP